MPENRDFSHLPLPFLYRGKPKLRGFNSPSERTNRNRNNRAHHGEYLKRRSSELSQFWKERRINRLEEDLPEIQVGIPILLEIEPSSNIEFLRGLGFEIVCEIEDGFIIVASEDIDLTRFNQKAKVYLKPRHYYTGLLLHSLHVGPKKPMISQKKIVFLCLGILVMVYRMFIVQQVMMSIESH